MRSKSKNRAEAIFAILAKTSTQFIGFHMSEYGHGSIPKSFNSPSFWPMFTHFCFVHTNNPENTRSFKVANKIYLIASWSSPYYGNSLFSLKVGIIFERLSYPVREEKIYHMTLYPACCLQRMFNSQLDSYKLFTIADWCWIYNCRQNHREQHCMHREFSFTFRCTSSNWLQASLQ